MQHAPHADHNTWPIIALEHMPHADHSHATCRSQHCANHWNKHILENADHNTWLITALQYTPHADHNTWPITALHRMPHADHNTWPINALHSHFFFPLQSRFFPHFVSHHMKITPLPADHSTWPTTDLHSRTACRSQHLTKHWFSPAWRDHLRGVIAWWGGGARPGGGGSGLVVVCAV